MSTNWRTAFTSPCRWAVAVLGCALLLAACSLTQYSVSEGEINQYLKERVAFEKQLGIPGIMSSKIRLDDMQSRIGRRQTIKRGQTVLWQGDESLFVGNVIEGVLKLSASTMDGRDQTLGIMFPSDVIGRPFGPTSTFQVMISKPFSASSRVDDDAARCRHHWILAAVISFSRFSCVVTNRMCPSVPPKSELAASKLAAKARKA